MGINLQHIDQSLVGFTPGQPEFEQLVSDTLGNAGDPSDGMDADLNSLILATAATDAAFDLSDQAFLDTAAAVDGLNHVDTSGLVEDFNQGVPVLNAFAYSLNLKTIGGLHLPAAAAAPSGGPPLQICVKQPPAPPQQPAPTPQPTPQPQECPPGQSFVSGQCVPSQPAPLPPIPTKPVPLPTSPPQDPCPAGYFVSTAGNCVPNAPAPTPSPTPTPAPVPDCPAGSVLIQYTGSDPVCREISGGVGSTPPQNAPITQCPPGTYPDYEIMQCVPCSPIMDQIDIAIGAPGAGACVGQLPSGCNSASGIVAEGCGTDTLVNAFGIPTMVIP